MRGFAQTLVNAMLGWIRALVEGMWALLSGGEIRQWIQWVGDNWLTLLVLLCLGGVVLDYAVWFLRWRPYYVWVSSIRRARRFFGGGKTRPEQEEDEARYRRPVQAPARAYEQEMYAPGAPSGTDNGWEEQPWEEQAWDEQPLEEQPWEEEPTFIPPPEPVRQAPSAMAETLLARPRKADYQEQYIRRFARPEADQPSPPAWAERDELAWAQPQEAFIPEPEMEDVQESWAPEASPETSDIPLHPGIDYQALSRQYGWQMQTQPTKAQGQEQVYQEEMAREQTGAQPGPGWDFAGLESFAPYRAPAPPPPREQRSERARKAKEEGTAITRMRSGLNRIVQRAGKVLTVDDEQDKKMIDGLPPPIDKRRAFHAPVYPNRMKDPQNPDFREDD